MNQSIVIIGGMMSWPNRYHEMRQSIAELSGTRAEDIPIAPLYPLDWAKLFRLEGWDRLLSKLGSLLSNQAELTGKPVLVIGHSLGGVIGKLLADQQRINGRESLACNLIEAVVGLGSPLQSRRVDRVLKFAELLAQSELAERKSRYLAVVGNAVKGDVRGTLQQKYAHQAYKWHTGRGEVAGDLMIPEPAMLSDGIPGIRLEGVFHEKFVSSSWYGAPAVVRQWWPYVVDYLDDAN